jgi:hypothetical protein
VLNQVDVDLNVRARQSLALIGDTPEVKEAPLIEEWKRVHMIWHDQPPDERIHVFVRLRATGKQKPLLRMELHLEAFFPLFRCSLMLQPLVPLSMLQRDSP